MPQTTVTLTTLGGTSLNPGGGEYTSVAFGANLRTTTMPRVVQQAERAGRGTAYGGTSYTGDTLRVFHVVAGTGATHEANLAKLKKEHYRPDLGPRTLVYVDGDGISKRATVVPQRLMRGQSLDKLDTTAFEGEWIILDAVFVADSADSVAAAAKAATPATVSVENVGSAPATVATVTMKPTAAKTAANGQRFRRYITPIWRVPRSETRPCDLTNTVGGDGWDHAAEVTATRSQADGDDVEIYVNGRRTNRWTWGSGTGSWNNSATRLWANVPFPAARYWTLTASAATGATSLSVREDLDAMPQTPFYIAFDDTGYDVARVTAYDRTAGTMTVVRDQRGTSATSAHAANVRAYYCPVLMDIVYGNTSMTVPYYDDAYKPMVLESVPGTLSDNGYWHYESFQETYTAGDTQDRKPRGGTWRTEAKGAYDREKALGSGDQYLRWIPRTATLSTDAAVATKMCLAFRAAGASAGHPLMDRWSVQSAVGITQVVHTRVTSTITYVNPPYEARLCVEGIDADGNHEVLETSEAAASATATLTPTGNVYGVVFRIEPYDPKTDGFTNQSMALPTDADGFTIDDVKLTFSTAEEPLFVWGASPGATANVYQFGRPAPEAGATIADADGNTLTMRGVLVAIDDTMTLDLDAQTATLGDGLSVAHLMTGTWPYLPPGTNNLTITDAGLAGGASVDIGVSSFRDTWL